MMQASKRQIMNAFEEATKDWGLDFTRLDDPTAEEGIKYEAYETGIVFGSFLMGYRACEERDPHNAWLKTRGH